MNILKLKSLEALLALGSVAVRSLTSDKFGVVVSSLQINKETRIKNRKKEFVFMVFFIGIITRPGNV